jgi:hypothetical protein
LLRAVAEAYDPQNTIFARQNAVGNSLGDVTTILQGRLVRLAFQMKF